MQTRRSQNRARELYRCRSSRTRSARRGEAGSLQGDGTCPRSRVIIRPVLPALHRLPNGNSWISNSTVFARRNVAYRKRRLGMISFLIYKPAHQRFFLRPSAYHACSIKHAFKVWSSNAIHQQGSPGISCNRFLINIFQNYLLAKAFQLIPCFNRNMVIFLTFQLQEAILPSRELHLRTLWRVGRLFEPFGLPIEHWHPPASTRKRSRSLAAFDRNGPTPAALEILRLQDEKDAMTDYRRTGVWTGKDKGTGGALSISFSSNPKLPTCLFYAQFENIDALGQAKNMQQFVNSLLDIWPRASAIEVGPFKYYTTHRVFPKRPGAGWMLYLPRPIARAQLPEAAELVPIEENGKQEGTMIVSVADSPFSIDNPEHVRIANAIEVRLADQDLLPR